MRSEARLVAVLGVAVSLWLFLAPVSGIDGNSCGMPISHTDEGDALEAGLSEGCGERNGTRVAQAWVALVLTAVAAGVLLVWSVPPFDSSANPTLTRLRRPHAAREAETQRGHWD